MEIYDLKDKQEYIREFAKICKLEWGSPTNDLESYLDSKVDKIKKMFNNPYYCTLILLDNDVLIGFISIFPNDEESRQDLYPWYATMYVKEEFRGHHYSKILNDAIIKEAKKRHIKRLYLKTSLKNYYEKFGAKYLDKLNDKENIYYYDI